MSIYSRPDSHFWWMELIDEKGTRVRKSTGIPKDIPNSRHIAKKIEAMEIANISLGRAGLPKKKHDLKFWELAEKFLAAVEGKTKPSTLEFYQYCLRKLLPFFRYKSIAQLSAWDLERYRVKRKSQDGVKDATINRNIVVLRKMLNWAVKQKLLNENPISDVTLVPEEDQKPLVRILSWGDEQRILSSISKGRPHLRAVIICALDTGMRKSELLDLEWQYVSFSQNLIIVPKSKTAKGIGRPILMTERVATTLQGLKRKSSYVFTVRGNRLWDIDRGWWSALGRAGVERLRFHDLRHTFNVRLMELGVLRDIRKALTSHSLGKDAHAVYTHVELPMLREAISKLDGWPEAMSRNHPRSEKVAFPEVRK